ncbi:MAG: GGDEF domain-containing protein [Phycisphaeraceae bacterium]
MGRQASAIEQGGAGGRWPGAAAEPGRVVVVGEDLAREVAGPLGACWPGVRVCAVHHFLFVLGEVGRGHAGPGRDANGDAGGPVAAVICRPTALDGLLESGTRGLRRLAPTARLIVVADEHEQAQAAAALRAGMDAVVGRPVDGDALARALGRGPVAPAAQASPHPSDAIDPASALEPPASPGAGVDDAELGDVDLVDAMLAGGQLEATAMRLLRARSGLVGVALAAVNDEIAHGRDAAEVRHRERLFGILHAPSPAAHLCEWAAWLGRWMALQQQVRQLETMAMRDELTGVWNRRYFSRFLDRLLERAARDRSQVTLLVFDIDNFKHYNDRYGHPAGDEILRETARLMQSFVRSHDVVARIGGDEFAVIFWDAEAKRRPDSHHPESVRQAARRFQQAVRAHRFPKLLNEAAGTLTISGGLASFPWDGRTPQELMEKADEMAMQSKQAGKNAISFGPGAGE